MVSQADELVPATEAFAAAIKAGDVAKSQALYLTTRTYWERIETGRRILPPMTWIRAWICARRI